LNWIVELTQGHEQFVRGTTFTSAPCETDIVVDLEQSQELSAFLEELIESNYGSDEYDVETVAAYCEDLLVDEVTEVVTESRPPRVYVFGRSGSGKSSVINALAGKSVATVGAVEPTTVSSDVYDIRFPDRGVRWQFVDSRGLFESVPPAGELPVETVTRFDADLATHAPDILLHVMTPDQVRAGSDDFEMIQELADSVGGGLPPRLMCLNKIDTYLAPGETWPPERNESLSRQIVQSLELVSDILSMPTQTPYRESAVQGVTFDSTEVIGVFPTYAKATPYWNVDTLSEVMVDYLPNEALLQFAQGQRRERLLRRLARKQTIAVAEAVSHVPRDVFLDRNVPIITGLEGYLLALIAFMSGRELSVEVVTEYDETALSRKEITTAISSLIGDSLRGLAGRDRTSLRNYIYAEGRSAEVYFFNDEYIPITEFLPEAREQFAQ
jgi:predicted GTPase